MAGGPETSPPSYEESRIKPMPGTYPPLQQQQPGPVTRGNTYRDSEQRCSMSFGFCPDPSDPTLNQDWGAVLMVKCRDVPCLMREGFHWDGANVIREEGYIDHERDFTCSHRRKDGKCWVSTRHYYLKDLQQPQRWVATIKVFALDPETVYQFDLINRLSRESMQWATAINQSSGHYIYNWHYCTPVRFNAIYDDMPMEGWWPWPRKNEAI
ncbi:hypothetical protein FHL15_005441 [Xylaria flabelliformis]|uniref:Uncharacterized protein n=1 Tax=Xylaria flabelliformis TaxID=2512241 RepID=A0A553I0Q5_9PEZI|nr:hypothetical protein FHL15_005441 [Xylaria flabelliformis]